MENKIIVPVHVKYLLTIKEASKYFGLGEHKLRDIVAEDPTADFIVNNGVKTLIKRTKFEKYIDQINCI